MSWTVTLARAAEKQKGKLVEVHYVGTHEKAPY